MIYWIEYKNSKSNTVVFLNNNLLNFNLYIFSDLKIIMLIIKIS